MPTKSVALNDATSARPLQSPITRRDWLTRAAAPALAAGLAYPLVAGAGTTATGTVGAPPASDIRAPHFFDIRAYGAIGDGVTLNTAAIQAAIDAAHEANGGVVLVPSGTFLSGTLELKSNVTLHLATQGKILGSTRAEDYHAGRAIPRGNGNIVFISAADAENITIEGNGTIDGNGRAFYTGRGDNTGPGQNSADGYYQRPHLLIFSRCKNLRIRDAFLTAAAYHGVRILNCERVYLDNVRVHNRVNKNNDGFHIVSSRYVHINGCDVTCQDDACALFGSNKYVTVANSTFSTRWSIFRFGGGEAENITISNCVIYETYGCAIKMSCRANSRFENISFSNIIMRDVTGPISIGLDSVRRRQRPGDAQRPLIPGKVRNISFSHIRGTVVAHGRQFADMHWEQGYRPGEDRTCITLNGVGNDFLENISLNDVHFTFEGGGTEAESRLRDVPQIAGEYFEIGDRPAHGVYARNVRGLTLDNIRIETVKPDLRPAVVLDNVSDAALLNIAAQGNVNAPSTLRCIQTTDTLISAPRLLTPAAVYLAVEGERSAAITLEGGDLRKAAKKITHDRGATPSATA
ncbi:glycoside hydrolase family 28 protein [Ereboglobus luteus]|uniref:Glycoside hydrolase n=1 Tax=Ereboglobus luteus TaxID=1796921 RepID=A0A2U8E631_9BACT|nr:glycosyl hydrolase family 28 protein [Ereboglobus luteus]AWI10270.1 glycoside hydrolase [Ereboglobus luteus]